MAPFVFYRWLLCGLLSLWMVSAFGKAETITDIAKMPSAFERARALNAQLRKATAAECAAYFAQTKEDTAPKALELLSDILRRWASLSPADALNAALALPVAQRTWAAETVMRTWAHQDPEKAFAQLLLFEKKPNLHACADGFFSGYAERDPQSAMDLVLKQRALHPWVFISASNPMHTIVREWAKKDPQTAFASIVKAGKEGAASESIWTFLHEWVKHDPKACLRALQLLPKKERDQYMKTIAQTPLPLEMIPMIIDFLSSMPGYHQTEWMLGALMENAARENQKDALPLLAQIKHPQKQEIVVKFFKGWASENFDEAMQYALAMQETTLRNAAIQGALESKINHDKPAETVRAMLAISDKKIRKKMIADFVRTSIQRGNDIDPILRQLPSQDEQRALLSSLLKTKEGLRLYFRISDRKAAESLRDWAMLFPAGRTRFELVHCALGQTMTMHDLLWATENLTPGEQGELVQRMSWNYGQNKESLFTIENFNALPEGKLRDSFMGSIVENLTKESPEKAYAWLSSLPKDEVRDDAYGRFLSGLINSDKLDVALDAMRNPPQDYKVPEWFYRSFTQKFAENDPSAAMTWAMQLTEKSQRENALDGVANYWGRKGEPEAFFALVSTMGNSPERDVLLQNFVQGWAERSPQKAAEWISANMLTHPEASAKAVERSFSNWVSNDPMAATQWMSTLPKGAVQERAIVALGRSNEAVKSPDDVLAWMVTLPEKTQSGQTRLSAISNMAENIRREAPDKLPQLLENNKLTPKEREAIQKVIDR